MSQFKESEHPRDSDGKFTDNDFFSGDTKDTEKEDFFAIQNDKQKQEEKQLVKVDLSAEVQKQISAAKTPKERQKIAFRYIMDNLRGQYTSTDGRTVAIERVGASKITSVDRVDKLRACPELAEMIKAGEYDHSAKGEDKPNKKFEEFAYYRVRVKMGDEIYNGILNVGIRADGSSTLYDLRPFDKESI